MADNIPCIMTPDGLFDLAGPIQGMTNSLFRQTTDVTVSNTITQTSIIGTGRGSPIISANSLLPGVALRIAGGGVYSSQLVLPASLTISIMVAGSAVSTATITNLLIGATNQGFSYSVILVTRTIGTSGTAGIAGTFNYISSLSGSRLSGDLSNSGNVVTFNTTANNAIDVRATWGTAATANVVKSTICNIEALR